MNLLQPAPEHKFAFGLRMVGRVGPDPSGGVMAASIDPCEFVHRLAELRAWGVSFRDDDLVPVGSTAGERADIVDRFRKALDDVGMVASMATTDLSRHPAFRYGALTASEPGVRRFALRKAMRAIDLGVECGAQIHVLRDGRERGVALAATPVRDALDRYREAIDFLCGYVEDQGYPTRIALAPRSSGPSGDAVIATIGHALAFIATLDHADMVGLSPTLGDRATIGAAAYLGVAQALWSGKLFHIDLDAGQLGRDDRDPRLGAGRIEELFVLVKLLEESGYDGPRNFDAGPHWSDDGECGWDDIASCMRTYLALATKCRRFADDLDIRDALEHAGTLRLAEPTVGPYSPEAAEQLAAEEFDPRTLADRGDGAGRLDRLVVDLMLGLR